MIVQTTRGALVVAAQPPDPYGAYRRAPSDSLAGQVVTPEGALALTSVYGAVSMISNTCGTMPLQIIDTKADSGRKVITGGELAPMLQHAPNDESSGSDLWTYVFACLLLRGNAYLAKIRDTRGIVTQLVPLQPADVTPYRNQAGIKVFRVRVFRGSVFMEADFTDLDILHIKGPSLDDPMVGASPIAHVRNAIGTQLAQTEYQAKAYADGMLIKGVLTTPERTLNPDSVANVKEQWKSTYSGVGASHDIAVLHSGITFEPVSLSPEDAQFIQTMKWGHTQVATAYQIPSSRLNGDEGSSGRYANVSQDDLNYFKQACMPRLIMVEGSLNRDKDLFGATSAWVPKFDTAAALRGDELTRFQVYRTEREIGTASQNDILRREDRPTIGAAGDDYTPLKSSSATPTTDGSPSGSENA